MLRPSSTARSSKLKRLWSLPAPWPSGGSKLYYTTHFLLSARSRFRLKPFSDTDSGKCPENRVGAFAFHRWRTQQETLYRVFCRPCNLLVLCHQKLLNLYTSWHLCPRLLRVELTDLIFFQFRIRHCPAVFSLWAHSDVLLGGWQERFWEMSRGNWLEHIRSHILPPPPQEEFRTSVRI